MKTARIMALGLVACCWCAAQSDADALAKLKRAHDASGAGRYAEAEAVAAEVLTSEESRGAADTDNAADALEILTDMAMITGGAHSAEALVRAQRAVAIREKLHGTESRYVAISLYKLAALLLEDGREEAARPYLERAVHIFESTPGRVENLAGAIGALGNLYVNLGEFNDAIRMFDRGLRALEAASGGQTRTAGNLLTNQAIAYRMLGRFAESKICNDRAVELYEKTAGPEHPLVILPLTNIASLLITMGKPAEALPYAERAMAVLRKNPAFLMEGSVLEVLAEAKGAADPLPGLEVMQQAVAYQREHHGDSSSGLMKVLPGLAVLRNRTGDRAGALEAALDAARIGRAYVDDALLTLAEREALLNAADCSRGLYLALSLVAARPADAGRVLDAVVRWRARVFDEMAQRRSAGDEELTREFHAARQELARLAVKGTNGAAFAQAAERKQKAERVLAAASAGFRSQIVRQSAGAAEVRRNLQAGAALVSFVRYDKACLDPAAGCHLFTEEAGRAYIALVTRATGEPVAVSLGDAKRVDALVQAVRQQIARKAEAPDMDLKRSEAAYRAAALALRQTVWDPLQKAVGGARQVFIVPDGSLHLINFAALPAGDSGYLIESGPEFHYLSSERDLAQEEREPAAGPGSLLAVGDPSFNAQLSQPMLISRLRGTTSNCASFQRAQFAPLPATGAEVDGIASVWRQATGGNVRELKRAQATEEAFKREAPGSRVLHLASHGFFLGDCPGAQGAAEAQSENPLVLSGIALAGANHRLAAKPQDEDGVLTAEEVAAMPLEGVEWAVLSACETGVGEIRDSEGVFGLRRAFQVAGARTVIMSLWQQDDESARKWMLALYSERFRRHATTSGAVRAAALSLLRERRAAGLSSHPWYWAGFVAAGDWR